MTTLQKIGVGVVVILAILGSIAFFRGSGQKFGATAFQQGQVQNDAWIFTGGLAVGSTQQTIFDGSGLLTIGTTGTALTRVNMGTCYILPYATTIAASSTATVDCQGTALIYNTNTGRATALTGVTNGDNVQLEFSTSTAGTVFGGIGIIGASASTTAGYITLRVSNQTGGTYTWPVTGSATGTATYIVTK